MKPQAKRQRTARRAAAVVSQPMTGPESGGIQFCIVCDRSILRGDHWRKIWAPDNSYAIGVHDACNPQAGAAAGGAR
jgi:hypothetical protein